MRRAGLSSVNLRHEIEKTGSKENATSKARWERNRQSPSAKRTEKHQKFNWSSPHKTLVIIDADNMPRTWCTCTSVSTEIIWINKTYCKIPGLWLVILVVLHLGHELEGNHPKGECDNCYRSQDDSLKLLHWGRVRLTHRKDPISWTIRHFSKIFAKLLAYWSTCL